MTLALRGVGHELRDGGEVVHALTGIELTVARGELVALLGPSGAGKSTLLWLATGDERPTAGTISWDGRDLAQLGRRGREAFRRETVGFLAQQPFMLKGVDAVGNVEWRLLGSSLRASQSHRVAQRLLVDLGLGDRLYHPPHKLSGGERRRVGLARALANDPELVLADEPAAGLDSGSGALVLARLREEAHVRRRAVLIVTHDAHAAEAADRCVTLQDGRLSSIGTPEREHSLPGTPR